MIQDFYNRPFPIIDIDNKLQLREQSLNDTQPFFEYYSNSNVSQYILAGVPENLTDAMNEIYYCRNLYYQKNGIYWSLTRKSDDQMIGALGLYINNHHNRAEICYDLSQEYWRQGIMNRTIRKVMTFAFNEIGLSRIEAVTLKENIPSISILTKLGYVHEGTLNNYRQFNGTAHNVELFAITPEILQKNILHNKK